MILRLHFGCLILILLAAAAVQHGSAATISQNFEALNSGFDRKKPKCEKITSEHCSKIGYNETRFPNFAGDENAETATSTLSGFSALIGANCNAELSFFLCSVYFPMCTEKVPDPIGPCKPLCLRVQKSCAPVLSEFKFEWPSALNCDKFPAENNGKHMCMPGLPAASSLEEHLDDEDEFEVKEPVHKNRLEFSHELTGKVEGGKCRLKDWIYVNRTAQCVPKCETTLDFTAAEITTARSTLVVGSMISVCFTTVCIVASCVQGGLPLNSRKPMDKSLFYCNLCFAISAGLYTLSLLLKDQIACTEYNETLLYAVRGLHNTNCTFVATLLYYFGSAGRLWWLLLCIAWRWNMKEHSLAEMEQFIFRAHIICWALPLFLVTMALMAQSIHPELVSGVCLVGSSSRPQYQIFIALREFLIMLTSILVLSSGCLNSVHNRSSTSSSSSAGFIGVLYPLAACFLLISSFQTHYSPSLGKWTPLVAFQLLADPSLGTLIGASYFVYILYSCYQTGTVHSTQLMKNGYLQGSTIHVQAVGNGTTTTTTCVTGPPQMTPPSLYHQVTGVPTSIGTYYSTAAGGMGGIVPPPPTTTGMNQPSLPQIPVPPVPTM